MTEMEKKQPLPVGLQSFEDIRRKGYLYVDKTEHIWRLINSGKVYFLSRPRRFGKSLLVSTMEAYFRGQSELFSGLAIEGLEQSRAQDAWAEHPVIRLDLSAGDYAAEGGLRDALDSILADTAERYGVADDAGKSLPVRFANLIRRLRAKTGRQVAILVDEYDSPLLDAADADPRLERQNRLLYHGFFKAVKAEDEHICFAFFTGVTRFTGVSVFSGLNNLVDISLDDDYSSVCGITQKELETRLSPWVDAMAEENSMARGECISKLARMYDGYKFSKSGELVYNPFSLLSALRSRMFDSYWFASGTPAFLAPRLKASGISPESIADGMSMTAGDLMDYRADNPNPIPLLYQAGYLTIDSYDREFNQYTLRFPNDEVKGGFFELLAKAAFDEDDPETAIDLKGMVLALRRGDTDGFMARLQSLFASIPYPEALEREYQWRDQMFIVFTLIGLHARAEVHFSHGRSDCVVDAGKHVYVFEFKVDKTAAVALAQIDEKGYAAPYAADPRTLHKVGVSFSSARRAISEWAEA